MAITDSTLLRRVASAVLAVDALIIALHLLTGGTEAFNLDAEGNVPTWYSSAKLLLIAVLCGAAYHAEAQDRGAMALPYRRLWIMMAALFTAMSLDETASLHERSARALVEGGLARQLRYTLLGGDATKDSFAWVVLFSPIALGVIFFLVGFAWTRRERLRRVLALGVGGLLFYITALVLEPAAMYFTPPMDQWDDHLKARYELFSMFEESSEILGTTFFLLTALSYVLTVKSDQRAVGGNATPQ